MRWVSSSLHLTQLARSKIFGIAHSPMNVCVTNKLPILSAPSGPIVKRFCICILRQPADCILQKIMSDGKEEQADPSCCSSCGIPEVDDVKLVPCDGCDLVRYCSDDCQEDQKSQHAEECKKRAAELRDELLFKQPENTHEGDCPICCLPMPLDLEKTIMYDCCSKVICYGCEYANDNREIEMGLPQSCPFCRKPVPETDEEGEKLRMKRIEANDPVALRQQGHLQYYLKGEYIRAFEYFTKSAELGDTEAHFRLAGMYREGKVEKDEKKEIHHYEEAAIGGHPRARYNLGLHEWNNNMERAVKHFVMAAAQGHDEAIKTLVDLYSRDGEVGKEDLATALRAHQAAVDATKSPQRKAADECFKS